MFVMKVPDPLYGQAVGVVSVDSCKCKLLSFIVAYLLPLVGSEDAVVGMVGFDCGMFVTGILLECSFCFQGFLHCGDLLKVNIA